MYHVVSFRPGQIRNRASFESQSKIYEYLQREYDYEFVVLTAESDEFQSKALTVYSVPDAAWKPIVPKLPIFPRRHQYRRQLDPYFEAADVVLTLDPTNYPQGALALRRANRLGIPAWFDASATLNGDIGILRELRAPWERRAIQRANGIVITVPKVIERFRERGHFNRKTAAKFTVMGHPVDVETFHPEGRTRDRDGMNVLTVSRLVPEKGIDYIITALAPLLRRQSDLTFSILGRGPMRPYLEKRIRREGIADSVEFLGTVPHNRVSEILRGVDVYVSHPVGNSQWEEFFGIANLEAMACGLPVIVTPSGGITYAIRDEGVAEFVDQRAVADLRSKLLRLLNDPGARVDMGESARRYVVENYSVETISEQYHRMLTEALEE